MEPTERCNQMIVNGHVIIIPNALRIKSMTKSQVINLIIFFASILMVMFSKYILFPWERDDIPSISVTVIGEKTTLLYEDEEVRDQDYNDLIKALEEL